MTKCAHEIQCCMPHKFLLHVLKHIHAHTDSDSNHCFCHSDDSHSLQPSKVKVAAHFPKLTPINTFQKIPQILRIGRSFWVPVQCVCANIRSLKGDRILRKSPMAQMRQPSFTNACISSMVSICFFTHTHWCSCLNIPRWVFLELPIENNLLPDT